MAVAVVVVVTVVVVVELFKEVSLKSAEPMEVICVSNVELLTETALEGVNSFSVDFGVSVEMVNVISAVVVCPIVIKDVP